MSTHQNQSSRRSKLLLDNLAARASAALSWETLWPVIVALLGIAGIFLTVSWLGLWINVPRWGRMAGLAFFGIAVLAALFPLIRFRLPARRAALARVDRDSGLQHSPATTLDDILANGQQDSATRALWNIHLRRAEANATALKVALPSPKVALRDRFAIRAGVLVAAAAAAFVAGPEKYARVLAAFDWQTAGSVSQGFRLDAWIDPPAYTGRPPILLKAQTDGNKDTHGLQKVRAPVGSVVIVRSSEGAGVGAEASGALNVPKPPEKKADQSEAPAAPQRTAAQTSRPGNESGQEQKFVLSGDGKLVLKRLGRTVAEYELTAIPDTAPKIAFSGEPRANVRGSLTIKYKLEDDYGVLSADAEFSKPQLRGKPVTGRTLVPAPKMNLGVAQGAGGLGEAETTTDLSEHPWAGAKVTVQLIARDEAGNIGRSEAKDIFLPRKVFVKPLARALVEQRRNLVLAPDDKARVRLAFEALTIEPEEYKIAASIYLGLTVIAKRLDAARNDDDLRSAADLIWEMALRIEEGDLSDAERELRAAQQALREAMNRGASEEEIKRLMDQLRAAMDRFLREFAEQQRRNPENQQSQDRNNRDREITSQDLQRMLNEMERQARSGNMADAQRMLDQLQNMLENLRSARRGNQQNQANREMNRALNQLDQMMRDQQQLRDRTHRESQRGQGEQQQQGDQSQQLQRNQRNLRQQLEDMQRRMQQFGMNPPQGFKEAEEAMRQAEGELGKGGREGQGRAVEQQGRALENLRRGAQSLAQQMQQQRGPGNQAGPGDPNGPERRDTANPDPLGREQHTRGDNSRSMFDPPGVTAAERAQRILEELRRRLSDPSRPSIELEYLERLLRRY